MSRPIGLDQGLGLSLQALQPASKTARRLNLGAAPGTDQLPSRHVVPGSGHDDVIALRASKPEPLFVRLHGIGLSRVPGTHSSMWTYPAPRIEYCAAASIPFLTEITPSTWGSQPSAGVPSSHRAAVDRVPRSARAPASGVDFLHRREALSCAIDLRPWQWSKRGRRDGCVLGSA